MAIKFCKLTPTSEKNVDVFFVRQLDITGVTVDGGQTRVFYTERNSKGVEKDRRTKVEETARSIISKIERGVGSCDNDV